MVHVLNVCICTCTFNSLIKTLTFDLSSWLVAFFFRFTFPPFLCFTHVVDIWAVGCIMAEMVRHKILFPGRDCILELLAAVSGSCYETEHGTQASILSSNGSSVSLLHILMFLAISLIPHLAAMHLLLSPGAWTHTTHSPKRRNCCSKHYPRAWTSLYFSL